MICVERQCWQKTSLDVQWWTRPSWLKTSEWNRKMLKDMRQREKWWNNKSRICRWVTHAIKLIYCTWIWLIVFFSGAFGWCWVKCCQKWSSSCPKNGGQGQGAGGWSGCWAKKVKYKGWYTVSKNLDIWWLNIGNTVYVVFTLKWLIKSLMLKYFQFSG